MTANPSTTTDAAHRKLIFASSLGTVFEWYDFYLYGALAAIIAQQFFSGLSEGSAFIFALLAFAAGFLVRPFGAVFFGRLGDIVGRKYTFLITLLLMGGSTCIVGMLPNYEAVGMLAPVFLIGLRLLQGFALGGEYGGAATYVAEHAPPGKRGQHTAWIQTTATAGLFLALMVITGTRTLLGEEAFAQWGWRVPFLLSFVLLVVSMWIRLAMTESPVFEKLKAEGKTSRAPLTESFGQWSNLKLVLLALFGLTAGQAVVWYTGHFYALFFLTETLKVSATDANMLVATALLLGAPFFVLFGHLSDRIGRKPVMLTGCLLAVLTYFPAFNGLTQAANPALHEAHKNNRVTLVADPASCSFQFNPIEMARSNTGCDLARQVLTAGAVNHTTQAGPAGSAATIRLGTTELVSPDLSRLPAAEAGQQAAQFRQDVRAALDRMGYPTQADPAQINRLAVVAILTYLVLLVTLVYGPVAAALVEMFPARIRYTSVSLPYHIGNGWFGGLLPAIAFAVVAQGGNIYSGLWYPILVAGMTFAVGLLLLRETKGTDLGS
jgi:MFS family permease